MVEIKPEEYVIMRAKAKFRDRLLELAKKRKKTLSALTDEALETFLQNEEYVFTDVLAVVDKIPSLKVSIEKIKSEMSQCPAQICKQIIDIIDGKDVFLFEENFESIQKKIEEVDKSNLSGIFLHISMKDNKQNEINEMLQKIGETLKDLKINIGIGAKRDDHDKIFLFLAYNNNK